MRLNGRQLKDPNEVVIVIPRSNGDDIILRARAVLDTDEFDRLCPEPKPPVRKLAGGQTQENMKDSGYLQQVQNHGLLRLSWIILKSLEATGDLVWDNVDTGDPTTWNNFREEMTDSGFSVIEINHIIADCLNVNALNEEKIEAARQRFLLRAQEPVVE
jgi:hypothetical protein